MDELTFVVEKEDNGRRLDVFLTEEIDSLSRSHIKNCISKSLIKVNYESVAKAGLLIKEGDIISFSFEPPQKMNLEPQNLNLDIVYEDAFLAVINKRQGMVTHPAPGSYSDTLVNGLLYQIKDLSSINGVVRPGIVHRLDKDTSGLIVIAKNDEAHISLQKQITEKSAVRQYMALLVGNIKEESGEILTKIGRSPADRKKMAVVKEGREAITYYKVLKRFEGFTLTEFTLGTGRTHQIRVHARHIHHPVAADKVYGFDGDKTKAEGQLLHAFRLSFNHPKTDVRMTFEVELPDYFQKIVDSLKPL